VDLLVQLSDRGIQLSWRHVFDAGVRRWAGLLPAFRPLFFMHDYPFVSWHFRTLSLQFN